MCDTDSKVKIMYINARTMEHLFMQLGLSHNPEAITEFIDTHHLLADLPLYQAEFWNESQAQFIRESWFDDAEWTDAIDQLDVMLRP